MAAERTGWHAISPRRLTAFFGQAEERPVASRAARAADAAIAAVATIAAVVAAIVQARTHSGPYGFFITRPRIKQIILGPQDGAVTWWPSPWILLGAAMTTAPLAFRRTYPITAFCVILGAVIGSSGHTTSITYAAVICAVYCAAAYSPFCPLALLSVLVAASS